VGTSRITVIDLDRMCCSDPALDVAMFFYRVRHNGARQGVLERPRAIASSFLARYRKEAPNNLINLGFYRALQCLKGLARFLKIPRAPGEDTEAQKQFYLREFEESTRSAPAEGASAGGTLARAEGSP
jgi:aminoglycoside phosphotransferase (APT) family kinase protein